MDLEKLIKDKANEIIATQGAAITCPSCESSINIRSTDEYCPICKQRFDTTEFRLK